MNCVRCGEVNFDLNHTCKDILEGQDRAHKEWCKREAMNGNRQILVRVYNPITNLEVPFQISEMMLNMLQKGDIDNKILGMELEQAIKATMFCLIGDKNGLG